MVIGDVTSEEAKNVVGKWFGGNWKASGAKPDVTLPRVPLNAVSSVTVPDPSQLQNSVHLSEIVGITRFDAGLLSSSARQSRAGRRILCDAPVSRPAASERLCVQRRRAHECDEDEDDVWDYVRVRSRQRIESQTID